MKCLAVLEPTKLIVYGSIFDYDLPADIEVKTEQTDLDHVHKINSKWVVPHAHLGICITKTAIVF